MLSEETQRQILQRIDALSQKLGVAANKLFALYVRQVYIDGFEYLIACALLTALSWTLYKHSRKKFAAELRSMYDDYTSAYFVMAAAIAFSILACAMIVFAIDSLTNPQLAAFRLLTGDLK